MNNFFLSIWKTREHKSEISGQKLYGEPLSIYFHHILKSRKYPQAKYDPDCVIIITFEEHQNAEADEYRYEEINKRRKQLKTKYHII